MTFAPDSLTVPNSIGQTYLYFTPDNNASRALHNASYAHLIKSSVASANEIMNRVAQRLGVRVETMGFASETDMVHSLAATPLSPVPTCFRHGAGKCIDASMYNHLCTC